MTCRADMTSTAHKGDFDEVNSDDGEAVWMMGLCALSTERDRRPLR